MKIAFLGNFNVDYTSESHYLKTLQKLGHEVLPLQEGKTFWVETEISFIKDCDMFFWVHTHGWVTPVLEDLLDGLRKKGTPIVGYHLDLWLGIERQRDLINDSYWRWMDYFFCTDRLMVDYLNNTVLGDGTFSYPKAFFLPAGVFEDECYIGDFKHEFAQDVIFVGSRGYHKEWPYREKLIAWLEQTYGARFKHYDHSHVPKMRGKNLNDLYASAKIVIGDTLCKDFKYPYYLSDRIFETTGRGGFIIHPMIKGLDSLFELGFRPMNQYKFAQNVQKELITYIFDDFKYLKYLIDYFLVHDEERKAIQIAGHERTKRDHTYTNRLSTLVQTVQDEINKNK